ncbi:MAG: phosphatidylserine decarboxylase [Bacteroidales bacterium]|nr:phosphatidylserine decarboxylase [Bacteroidales bacterium]MBP5538010.1 phosphatidylserine decarboxylase [Bacteroidales bacterium]
MFRIDKDSIFEVIVVILFAIILITILLTHIVYPWFSWGASILLLLLAIANLLFHRVPHRMCPGGPATVSAVADGQIVEISKVQEDEWVRGECVKVSIYMNFFDVHANFWPIDGKVDYYQYYRGRKRLAFSPKASEDNEHSCTGILNPDGQKVFFKQLAGSFARRIVCYSKPGLEVRAGEQCGIIKFGSRIDFYLPLDAEIVVKIGDRVRACESVIAKLR